MKRTAGWSCSVFFSFSSNSLAKATWWWMLLYRTLRKVPGMRQLQLFEAPTSCRIPSEVAVWPVTRGCTFSSLYVRQGESLLRLDGDGESELVRDNKTLLGFSASGYYSEFSKIPQYDIPSGGSSVGTCMTIILRAFPKKLCSTQH